MICPYNFKKIEQINQNTYDYEDGLTKVQQHKMIEYREFADCVQKQCGAWDHRNACCGYKGAVE